MSTQAAAQPGGQDPVRVDSKHYSIELEDEKVRVLRVRYGLGEKSTMHTHPELLGVMLTDYHLRFQFPDGSSQEVSGKASEVMRMPATEHLPENLSDQVFLSFENAVSQQSQGLA